MRAHDQALSHQATAGKASKKAASKKARPKLQTPPVGAQADATVAAHQTTKSPLDAIFGYAMR